MAALTTKADRAMLRAVLAGARKAGLRVPVGITLKVVPCLPRNRAQTTGRTITVERGELTYDLLCHEVAHVLIDQLVEHHDANDHNRFWALCYGTLYQNAVQR